MNTYETMFITPPTLAEEDEKLAIELVAQIITDGGGTIIAKDLWGRRRLAYPIQKHEDGNYTRFLYEASAEIPAEVERRNRLSDRVMRSLTLRLDKQQAINAREQAVLDAERRIADAKAAEERAIREAEEAVEAEKKAAADAIEAEKKAAADAIEAEKKAIEDAAEAERKAAEAAENPPAIEAADASAPVEAPAEETPAEPSADDTSAETPQQES